MWDTLYLHQYSCAELYVIAWDCVELHKFAWNCVDCAELRWIAQKMSIAHGLSFVARLMYIIRTWEPKILKFYNFSL